MMPATAEPTVVVEFSRQEAQALCNSSQLVLQASGLIGLSDDATALDWAHVKLAAALDQAGGDA